MMTTCLCFHTHCVTHYSLRFYVCLWSGCISLLLLSNPSSMLASVIFWINVLLQDLQTSSATFWKSKVWTSSTLAITSLVTSSNRRNVRAGRLFWSCRSSPRSCRCGRIRKVRRSGQHRIFVVKFKWLFHNFKVFMIFLFFCRFIWGA